MVDRIRIFPRVLISSKHRLLTIGLFSTVVAILLVTSFQFIYDHRWYWSIAPFICIVAMFTATYGGLLIGRTFSRTRSTQLWMVIAGILLCGICIGAGMLAASLGALGMSQLLSLTGHIGWDTYTNSFLFSGSEVRFLQITAGSGFIAGLTFGLGVAWRRTLSVSLIIK